MRLLTLDLATRLGWAFGDTDGDPAYGMQQLPSTGDDIGAFALAYDRWLNEGLERAVPDWIVFEEPMVTTAGKTPLITARKLQGLCWHTEFIARTRGIEYRQVAAQSWKRAFCGPGVKVSKQVKPYPVITACRARGWDDVFDDNTADALGLWAYSVGVLDPKQATRFDPLFRKAAARSAAGEHRYA